MRETQRIDCRVPDLPTLAKRIMDGEEIEETELRAGKRKREVGGAKRVFFSVGDREDGLS